MIPYILDASVILKWYFEELFQKEAWDLLENEAVLCATPDFAIYECAGAIRRKIASNEITEEDGQTILETIIEESHLEFISSRGLLNRSFKLSNTIQHDLYDCIYLACAEKFDTKMVTADKKFYDCVLNAGEYINYIHWIEHEILINDEHE